MEETYYIERYYSEIGPDRWAVRGPNQELVECFAFDDRIEAEHLADLLNAAYEAGMQLGLSANAGGEA